MDVLLVHRYFEPDSAAYGRLLAGIADWLADEGHAVEVLSAMPSYDPDASDASRHEVLQSGVTVRRLRLVAERRRARLRRAVNAVLFAAIVGGRVAAGSHDIVMFGTQPPVLLGIVIRMALGMTGRSGRYVYHVQDVHPEVSMRHAHGCRLAALAMLARGDAVTMRLATRVVTLSGDMAHALRSRPNGNDARIDVINNHPLGGSRVGGEDAGHAVLELLPATAVLVTFAGNLGRFQRLDEVVAAFGMAAESEPDLVLLLLGDGVEASALRAQVAALGLETRVLMPGAVSVEAAASVLARTDLAVVSLQDDMLELAYPSKTQTYLLSGARVLATAGATTSLGQAVTEMDGLLADTIGEMAEAMVTANRLSESERSARRAKADEKFGTTLAREAWTALFAEIAEELGASR